MYKRQLFILSLIVVFLVSGFNVKPVSAHLGVNMTTQHNDNQRTGANLQETILNTSNVNQEQFGKLYEVKVEGQIYAQPLYLSSVEIDGATHNVLYVATMHNMVYCIDADDPNGKLYWSKQLSIPVALPDSNIGPKEGYGDIRGEVGILSTPVISQKNMAIYVVAMTRDKATGEYMHKLHALDLFTGADKFGPAKKITASVTNSQGQAVPFVSNLQAQRPALTLVNDRIYIGSASFGARHPYYGWVLGYNATTLEQELVFNTAPDAEMGGVWSSGQGMVSDPADPNGDLYFLTGAGEATAMRGGKDYGDSVIKLNGNQPAGSPPEVKDYFTPYNQEELWHFNKDLGASGSMMIPGSKRLVHGSKEGKLFVLDTDKLGKFDPNTVTPDSQIVQWIQTSAHHIHGSPVYWKGPRDQRVYVWPEQDKLKAYTFDGNKLSNAPVSQSQMNSGGGMPGGFLTVSAHEELAGTGIIWANMPLIDDANVQTVDGILRAFDANDLSKELWNSEKIPERNKLGKFAKFVPPTVANGKVYMATFSGKLNVYGLLSPPDPTSLISLTLNNGAIQPIFDSSRNTYSTSVTNEVYTVTVSPVAAAGASISLNGKQVLSGQSSEPIPLNAVGDNSIKIIVTTGDGGSKEYTLTVTRLEISTRFEAEDAQLLNGAKEAKDHANYSGRGFVDSFVNGNTRASTRFTVNMASAGPRQVALRYSNGTGSPKTLSIYVNDTKIKQTTLPSTENWDTWSDKAESLQLNAGRNTIAYQYDPQDTGNVNLDYISVPGTTMESDNALLNELTLNGNPLALSDTQFLYSARVSKDVNSISVVAIPADAGNATTVIKVGEPSAPAPNPISLDSDQIVIKVEVTAQDGKTKNTYSIVVTRGEGVPETPTKYEAEDADRHVTGAVYYNKNYSGRGFVDGYFTGNFGASTTFTVNSVNAGPTKVALRYANGTDSPKTLSIYVNDIKIKQTELPATKDWDTWNDQIETLTLIAGTNTIAYKYDQGDTANVNLDYITLLGTIPTPTPVHDNALLKSLTLHGIPLDKPFSETEPNYSATVPNETTQTFVEAIVADLEHATAVVKLGASETNNPVTLAVGGNEINVEVTAGDRKTKKLYKIAVTREAAPVSTNALLSGLTLDNINLNETVTGTVYKYTAKVPYTTASTSVHAFVADATATAVVTVGGSPVANPVELLVGETNITVEVTAGNGKAKQLYIITVNRDAEPPSDNALLSSLAIGGTDLSPAFTSTQMVYTATVTNATYHIEVTAVTGDPKATKIIKLNGQEVTNPIPLEVGNNTISIEVTSPDGKTKSSYTIYVMRTGGGGSGVGQAPSALLSSMSLSNASLGEINFSPAFTSTQNLYTATVTNATYNIEVTAVTLDPNATKIIKLNGQEVTNPIPLEVGNNAINIEVTAADGKTTNTYTINVTRDVVPQTPAPIGGGGGGGGGWASSEDTPPKLLTDASGKKTWVVKPDKDKLLTQLDQTTNEVVIDGTSTESVDQLTIELAGSVVEKAKKLNKTIVIKGNGVQLTLPPDIIGVNVDQDTLKFDILKSNSTEKMPFGQFISPSFEFTLTAEDNFKVPSVSKSMEISFNVDESKIKNPDHAELYLFNEATQKWEHVTGSLHNGTMTASVSKFAKYAVFEAFKTFADIQGHWAQKEIEDMAVRQIVDGMTDTAFEPDGRVTRAQFVSILARALKLPKNVAGNQFRDIPADAWYMDSVNSAYQAKIVSGIDDGKFGPDNLITREQMATMLVNAYLYLSNKKSSEVVTTDGITYTDAAAISEWAKENVKLASGLELMNGTDHGMFSPAASATRAQASVVIYRVLNKK